MVGGDVLEAVSVKDSRGSTYFAPTLSGYHRRVGSPPRVDPMDNRKMMARGNIFRVEQSRYGIGWLPFHLPQLESTSWG